MTLIQLDDEINWTRNPTLGPDENFGAPTASDKYFQGLGSGSLSFSFRNFANNPFFPRTLEQGMPKACIWYFPLGNFCPAMIWSLFTLYVPHGGNLGPGAWDAAWACTGIRQIARAIPTNDFVTVNFFIFFDATSFLRQGLTARLSRFVFAKKLSDLDF